MLALPDAERAERLLPGVLGATIVAFTFGSSAALPLLYLGRVFRWPLLLVLAFLALRWAAARAPRPALPRALVVSSAALVALALVSEAWTGRAILTVGRAVSLGILFAAAAALAIGSASRPEAARRLLGGMLAAAAVVAVLGVLLAAVDYSAAVQAGSRAYPTRYRGVGENPNTVSLLLAVTLPIALWQLAEARSPRRRLLLGATLALFVGTIVAANSRGALVGALAGTLVLVVACARSRARRALLAAASVAVAALALGAMTIPKAHSSPRPPTPPATRDAEQVLPLEGEIGRGPLDRPRPQIHRSLFGSSGRGQAWSGAFHQALDRPLLGYGFGTEASVFTDRFYYFYSATPENTYLGAFLQVGALGLACFLGLVASVLMLAVRALRAPPPGEEAIVAVATSVFVGALAIAITQTYLLAVGNLATAAVWICGFLAAAASARSPSPLTERQQRQNGEGEVEPA